MSTTDRSSRTSAPAEVRVSLSQFAAQILGQLRLTAWLPGATVIGGVYVATGLRLALQEVEDNGEVGLLDQLVAQLQATNFETIVLMLLSTAVVATATQSFAFAMIRLLEGYWGSAPLARPLLYLGLWLETQRRSRLERRLERLRRRAAWTAAISKAPSKVFAQAVVAVTMAEPTEGFSDDAIAYGLEFDWHALAPARLLRPIEDTQYQIDEMPENANMMMPTRVGNVIRRAEIEALGEDPRMEMAVARVFDRLPTALQVQHDEARGQLDLYGLLVAASLLLSVVGGTILWSTPLQWWWIGGTIAWAVANQKAMLASARNYAAVLMEISAASLSESPTS